MWIEASEFYTQHKHTGRAWRVERHQHQDGQHKVPAFQSGSQFVAIIPCLGPSLLLDRGLSENFHDSNENTAIRIKATGTLTVKG